MNLLAPAVLTKLVVVGGYDGDHHSTVSVIDLESVSGSCPDSNLSDYPMIIDDLTVTFVDGKVKACGGHNFDIGATVECYNYDFDTDQWTRRARFTNVFCAPLARSK